MPPSQPLSGSSMRNRIPGGLGVTIFLFLSGFLIAILISLVCSYTHKVNLVESPAERLKEKLTIQKASHPALTAAAHA